MKKKEVKVYKILSADQQEIIWTTQREGIKGEKVLGSKNISLPVKTGYIDNSSDFITPVDAKWIRKELKDKKQKKMRRL